MTYLRQLGHHFDPVYIKPGNVTRAVTLLQVHSVNPPRAEDEQVSRRQQDRRCGVDRRRQQHPILLDTRSPHARRKQSRRRGLGESDPHEDFGSGIDVYV